MPGGDLVFPADEGAPERAGFDRIVRVLEIASELGHPLEGERRVSVRIELAHRFLGFPERGHIPVGVAGT